MKQTIRHALVVAGTLAALTAPVTLNAAEPDDSALPPDQGLRPDVGPRGWQRAGMPPPRMNPRQSYRMGKRAGVMRERARGVMTELDENQDGMLDLDEFQLPPQNRFGDIDANSDSALTLEEMKAHRERMADERLAARFAALDADGDGMVTQTEMRESHFTRMDRDGDGYLTPREMVKARKDRPRQGRGRRK